MSAMAKALGWLARAQTLCVSLVHVWEVSALLPHKLMVQIVTPMLTAQEAPVVLHQSARELKQFVVPQGPVSM